MSRAIVLALLASSSIAACAGNPALDRRVADLETHPAHDPTVDARFQRLEARLVDSEKAQRRQADEIKELQKIIHELADQVADALADRPIVNAPVPVPTPPPLPLPTRMGPDPLKVYAVTLDDSPVIAGSARSAVTIVAGVQFPEPFTHRSWPVLQQLIADYGPDLRIVIKPYIVHPQATDSTIAACAVAMQKKLDAFEDKLWTLSMASGARRWPDAAESRVLAKSVGVDLKLFDRDLTRTCAPGKLRDGKLLAQLGQNAVPEFWINGHPLSGAQPIASFKAVIDVEKAKADADRAHGGSPATYYDRAVVRVGLTSP
ncbi:MAG: hypothetical protein NT062_22180 [Proteobacteria bacterium]|nr:hypothetical protein [Pseudomonadota bacterium]